MENNNNGRGIFYGVIGVATLVVAIIGATFAYFTATASNNVITGNISGVINPGTAYGIQILLPDNYFKNAIKKEPISLDTLVTDDLCIQDYIEDTTYISPESSTQNKLQEKDITKLISTLNKREQEIIKRRFGIENNEPKTLEQIGKSMGFSKERMFSIVAPRKR